MSIEDNKATARPEAFSGTQFLDELEKKHNHVLDELDALNTRIERVLAHYAESRQMNEHSTFGEHSGTNGPHLPRATVPSGISLPATTATNQPTRNAA